MTCQVAITNDADVDYYLLKRDTPLEGLMSHMFSIKNMATGQTLPYDGFYYKFLAPTLSDYIRIPAKTSLSSSVALTDAYSFNEPSVYSMSLDMPLHYIRSLVTRDVEIQRLSSEPSHVVLLGSSSQARLTKAETLRRQQAQVESESGVD